MPFWRKGLSTKLQEIWVTSMNTFQNINFSLGTTARIRVSHLSQASVERDPKPPSGRTVHFTKGLALLRDLDMGSFGFTPHSVLQFSNVTDPMHQIL